MLTVICSFTPVMACTRPRLNRHEPSNGMPTPTSLIKAIWNCCQDRLEGLCWRCYGEGHEYQGVRRFLLAFLLVNMKNLQALPNVAGRSCAPSARTTAPTQIICNSAVCMFLSFDMQGVLRCV
jgi:hypothetical protein